MQTSDSKGWPQPYALALLEVDMQKMPERIVTARQAIEGRLKDLAHDSDHHAERQEIEDALSALRVLEKDTIATDRSLQQELLLSWRRVNRQ